MENSFEYRYFLLINHLANKAVNHSYQNFAKLIKEEEEGRFMNKQMTFYFYVIDNTFSELIGNDEGWIFELLDIEKLSEIPPGILELDYKCYCVDDEEFLKFKI